MNIRHFAIGLLVIGFISLLPVSAKAHVLITDDANKIGAVLHIVPDDDPIAGQSSQLSFDIQKLKFAQADLTITGSNDVVARVPITIDGQFVNADYTFPYQGAYTMTLRLGQTTFHYVQRVSRGQISGEQQTTSKPLATAVVVISATGLLVLAVVAASRWRDIKKYSTF